MGQGTYNMGQEHGAWYTEEGRPENGNEVFNIGNTDLFTECLQLDASCQPQVAQLIMD